MEKFEIFLKSKAIVLALGSESAGNFSVYKNGKIYFSKDFGDLSDDANYEIFTKKLNKLLKIEKIKPTIILSDLHPLFRTTQLGEKLAKKYKAKYFQIQHHLAHVFSAIGDQIMEHGTWNKEQDVIGIACDGTGYSEDGTIWGGEIFKIQKTKNNLHTIRIGHLENQTMLGGEMAIEQPARMLISILSKFLKKEEVYKHVKKYYSKNEFRVLHSQSIENFNCLETSSTARILDAVSVLLGFSKNERLSKHGPITLLEANSTQPYLNINPKIEILNSKQIQNSNSENLKVQYILNTTFLFEYLIKNLHKDKKRLAATAQKYIADGLLEIIKLSSTTQLSDTYFAGGMANNKIMSETLSSRGVYLNKKIPRGDAGISYGQILYYLLANPRN